MDKDKKEWEKKAKCVYVPPKVEAYAAEPSDLMATTIFDGDHLQGDINGYDESDHERGDLELGGPNGAKQMILGTEFSFSDLWEE